MCHPYTSTGILDNYPVGQVIEVYFFKASAAYQAYGHYIIGSRLEQKTSDATESDFLLNFRIIAQANARREVGREAVADVPKEKPISFRGSEVIVIEAYG